MYVTTGDGTPDSDTDLTGQRTDLLLAKVLRSTLTIRRKEDVQRSEGQPVRREEGLRAREDVGDGSCNPWRITYDAQEQATVGRARTAQDLWEQAFLVKKGDNYGWSVTEGSHPFYLAQGGPGAHREADGGTPPLGSAVAHRRRGVPREEVPGVGRAYIYGDYSTGHIWAVKHTGEKDRVAQEDRALRR